MELAPTGEVSFVAFPSLSLSLSLSLTHTHTHTQRLPLGLFAFSACFKFRKNYKHASSKILNKIFIPWSKLSGLIKSYSLYILLVACLGQIQVRIELCSIIICLSIFYFIYIYIYIYIYIIWYIPTLERENLNIKGPFDLKIAQFLYLNFHNSVFKTHNSVLNFWKHPFAISITLTPIFKFWVMKTSIENQAKHKIFCGTHMFWEFSYENWVIWSKNPLIQIGS